MRLAIVPSCDENIPLHKRRVLYLYGPRWRLGNKSTSYSRAYVLRILLDVYNTEEEILKDSVHRAVIVLLCGGERLI